MRNQLPVTIKILSLASLALLAACSMLSSIPGTGGLLSGTPQSGTAYPAISTPSTGPTASVSTALPGNGATATPEAASPATAGATAPAGQDLSVTLADDGKTVHFKVGQRFLLNLGAEYNWNPVVADQSIVSRVIGILVIRGAQGIYEAHAPGTTTLTATGDPTCRQSKPACAMPSRVFKVTLVVEQ